MSIASEKSIFPIPPIIRRLFDSFPLITYPPEALPARCPKPSERPSLYVWISRSEARRPGGGYSFDPECLKWQTYLRFCGIEYRTISSNNHACPPSSGSTLPFLIPPASTTTTAAASSASSTTPSAYQSSTPIPSMKLAQWARDNSRRRTRIGKAPAPTPGAEHTDDEEEVEEEVDPERGDVQAFMELLDNEIKDALLYITHIHPTNLHNITTPLSTSTRSTTLIHSLIASELKSTALMHLRRRHPGTITPEVAEGILADAETALDALSGVLGTDMWFFGGKEAGLMDATVFGYLHIILTGEWEEKWVGGLKKGVKKRKNLMEFWQRVRDGWWEKEKR